MFEEIKKIKQKNCNIDEQYRSKGILQKIKEITNKI